MKGIVVGAGGTTRELLRRLGEAWDISVVETDRGRLDAVRAVRPIKAVLGDGTSRLVLERAGIADADALVAASNDDDVNLEACRLAREQGIHRVAAVAADPERLADYVALGVAVFSHDRVIARRLEESLVSQRITSQSFAQGRAEVIEFEVGHGSPVRGRSLKELRPKSWVVGAILRGQDLLIPHGDTVLREGDRVTVVGSGAEFSAMVRTFTKGEAHFPLDYGKSVALPLDEKHLKLAFPEAAYFVKNSRAASLLLAHRSADDFRDEEEKKRLEHWIDQAHRLGEGVEIDLRSVNNNPTRALFRLSAEESVGMFVRIAPPRGYRSLWAANRAVALARRFRRPVLLCRGTFPYRRIVVPARRTEAGITAGRAAIDLAVQSKAQILALAALDPYFIAGPEPETDAQAAISVLREESGLLNLHLEGRFERGNPVRIFLEATKQADLLVLGVGRKGGNRFQMGVVDHLASRSSASILLVPVLPPRSTPG